MPYGITPDPSPKANFVKPFWPLGSATVQTGAVHDGGSKLGVGSGTRHLVQSGLAAKSLMQFLVSIGRPYLIKRSRMSGHS